jgi:hypothetical protein
VGLEVTIGWRDCLRLIIWSILREMWVKKGTLFYMLYCGLNNAAAKTTGIKRDRAASNSA